MDVFILAQLIGLFGYGLYVAGPYHRERQKVLQMDMLACLVLMVQWALLFQPLLVMNNLLGMLSSLVVLSGCRPAVKSNLLLAFYPLTFLVFAPFWTGHPADVLALCAVLTMLTARRVETELSFRIWAFSSGIFLIMAGFMAGSVPAVMFNAVFVLGHLQTIVMLLIQDGNRRLNLSKVY